MIAIAFAIACTISTKVLSNQFFSKFEISCKKGYIQDFMLVGTVFPIGRGRQPLLGEGGITSKQPLFGGSMYKRKNSVRRKVSYDPPVRSYLHQIFKLQLSSLYSGFSVRGIFICNVYDLK